MGEGLIAFNPSFFLIWFWGKDKNPVRSSCCRHSGLETLHENLFPEKTLLCKLQTCRRSRRIEFQMRKKRTNFLQAVVLITGLIYIAVGIVFYFSPAYFGKILSMEITEDWFKGIMLDPFITTLFFLARGLASLLFSVGAAMVLPLYDPLKYRGLIYFTGILFPVMSSSLMIYNGIKYDYLAITLSGLLLLLVLALTAAGLFLTAKDARAGVE